MDQFTDEDIMKFINDFKYPADIQLEYGMIKKIAKHFTDIFKPSISMFPKIYTLSSDSKNDRMAFKYNSIITKERYIYINPIDNYGYEVDAAWIHGVILRSIRIPNTALLQTPIMEDVIALILAYSKIEVIPQRFVVEKGDKFKW